MSSVQGNSSFTGVVNQAVSLPTLNVGTLTASSSTSSSVHVPSASISGAVTLTAADSGRLLTVTNPTGAPYIIDLPMISNDLEYNFVVAGPITAAQNVSLRAFFPGMIGGIAVITSLANSGLTIVNGAQHISFVGGSTVIGDHINLRSDGYYLYVSGSMSVAGGIAQGL